MLPDFSTASEHGAEICRRGCGVQHCLCYTTVFPALLLLGLVITEPQTAWGWKRPLDVTWYNPLLKQGHLQQVAQDYVWLAFGYL